MDADIKKHLDLQLAKGQINKEEYYSLLRTIKQHETGGEKSPSDSRSTSSLLLKYKDKLLGPSKMVIPTDDHPIVVDEELMLFSTHLTNRELRVPYSDIVSITYKAESSTFNFVLTSMLVHFVIGLRNGQKIGRSKNSTIIRGRTIKMIQNAYAFLQQVTFRQRLDAYLHKLGDQGYIDIGNVRVFANGDIQRGDLRLNLSRARKNKVFGIGTSGRWGLSRSSDPDEVLVGETGTSVLSKRIVFALGYDKDVFKFLLDWLAKAE